MSEMKHPARVAAVLGDVVSSRTSADRPALHRALTDVLDAANADLGPLVALRITVGDEFQGCFATVGEALHATLWLRLALLPVADLRHGVGWGEVAVLADRPRVEDGPAWWAARAAIEAVKEAASRAAQRSARTAYRLPEGGTGPDPLLVNAALMCRDEVVGSASERSVRLLRGTLQGRTQRELAEEEGISASAVSQRVRHDGLGVVLAADALLREVT